MLFTLFGNEYNVTKQEIEICREELGIRNDNNNNEIE